MMPTTPTTSPRTEAGHRLSASVLQRENQRYQGTGGVSQNNRSRGFVPAFLDTTTGQAYESRFPDGRPAPMHLLDGLPEHLLIGDHDEQRVKKGVVSGFLHCDEFLTRAEAAAALQSHFQA